MTRSKTSKRRSAKPVHIGNVEKTLGPEKYGPNCQVWMSALGH